MSPALAHAVRSVLDHGRSRNGHVEISTEDYAALAGSFQPDRSRKAGSAGSDPAYEREMRRMFELAELDP